jgi:hypothetical protein
MYAAFAKVYPGLARYIRVTEPSIQRFFER